MLSEMSRLQKDHMISLTCRIWNKVVLTELENRMVVTRASGQQWERTGGEMLMKGYQLEVE
jgi:hypothetical protein